MSIVLERIGNKKENGYWAPVCINHGYMGYYDSP